MCKLDFHTHYTITDYENWGIVNFEGFILKLRGDGKRYQFRCRMGKDFDEV